MEINYDLIIKYLVTKKNTFASKKHILVYSDLFPEKFKDFFQNKFYRYGINQIDSIYVTLLILLNKNFISSTTEEEKYEINKFKKSINQYDLLINLKNKTDIQILSDILDINFIIFDFKNEDIQIIYPGSEECNPYKPTLLFANYEEFYEPIIYETENKKIFSYNDQFIKKIYQTVTINKNIKLKDNILEIINDFNPKKNNENQTFIKTINNEYDSNKLIKLTKKDLQVILDKKNIKINISKMLKKDIVELIMN
jgi:hypothetical protein